MRRMIAISPRWTYYQSIETPARFWRVAAQESTFFTAYSLHHREPSLHLQFVFLQIAGNDFPGA